MRYTLLMLLFVALIFWGWAADGEPAPRTTVQEVAEGLTCQCGCGLTVANCNHPSCGFAIPTRGEIADLIRKGMSRAGILTAFRHKYGEKILSAPTAEGFNLLAWIIPYVAVGSGMLLILMAVIRWRRGDNEHRPQAVQSVSAQFDPGLRQQLEQDLRRQL
jgi:cytochrome c-type biogenesis protein CcmH/NrfF